MSAFGGRADIAPAPQECPPMTPHADVESANLLCCTTQRYDLGDRSALNDFAKIGHCGARVDAVADREVFSQTAVKTRHVGLLSSGAPFTDASDVVVGLKAGFSMRGYVVGNSLLIERRAAEAHLDRLPGLVDDLKSEAELIITNSYAAARVVKDRANIPVVAITGGGACCPNLKRSASRRSALRAAHPLPFRD
jgi:hypothetical protein